jgi:hypothetical protein
VLNPNDTTTWIASKHLGGDKVKAREILQYLESIQLVTSKKNALNHYQWTLTELGHDLISSGLAIDKDELEKVKL